MCRQRGCICTPLTPPPPPPPPPHLNPPLQADCPFTQISQWVINNLDADCVTDLGVFNTSWSSPAGMAALDRTCTDDSCGGALYRYLLARCSPLQSFVQQQRCATNGTLRCFYGEYPTAYPTFFNNTAFQQLQWTCAMANATNPCPDGCAEALWTLRWNIGCCFNNYYNATFANNPWQPLAPFASYELWTACRIPTLDRCPEILSPNAPTTMPTAGSGAITASVGVLLLYSCYTMTLSNS